MNIDVNESEVLRAQKGEGSFYIVNKKVGASNVQHCQVHSQKKEDCADAMQETVLKKNIGASLR